MKVSLKGILMVAILMNIFSTGALADESYAKPSEEVWRSMSKEEKKAYRKNRQEQIQAHKAEKKQERAEKKQERAEKKQEREERRSSKRNKKY
jgi:hypothetical protein